MLGLSAKIKRHFGPDAPNPLKLFAIHLAFCAYVFSSVFFTCSYTRCIIGFPSISANGLPGKRDDAYLAGIIAINFILFLIYISLFLSHKPASSHIL